MSKKTKWIDSDTALNFQCWFWNAPFRMCPGCEEFKQQPVR